MPSVHFERLPLLKNLISEERAELEPLIEEARFEPDERIFSEGRPEEHLYILITGSVEVYKRISSPGGRRHHLASINSPAAIGEMGLLTDGRAAATVEVREPVEAVRIPDKELLKLLDSDSTAAWKIVYELGRTLAERMAQTDESIAEIVGSIDRENYRDFDVFQDKLLREWSF